jgi:metal-responsive CopG/Arc/MetJ family transcriptional regulator
MPRFSIEVPADLLAQIDEEATRDDRSRIAEIRVLLGEALAARRAGKAP